MVSQTQWVYAFFASVAVCAVAGQIVVVDTGCCQNTPILSAESVGAAQATTCLNKPSALCILPGDQFTANAMCTSTATCQSTAGMSGDPVMVGFDNVTFEFFGKPFFNYSVLATTSLDVNMQLVPAGAGHVRHQGGEGTFAGGMAVISPSHLVVAFVDEAGNMTFTTNGFSHDIEVPASFEDGLVTYQPYEPGLGQVLTVNQPPLRLQLVAVKQFTDEISGHNRGHFDLRAELTGHPELRFSGVLGDTLYKLADSEVQPEEAHYEVSMLSSKTFTGPSASRRLLSSTVPSLSKFPAFASLHT